MVPFESLGAVSYFPSIVIMALSCIISEISPLLIANRDFFIPVAFGAPVRGSSSEYCNSVWYGKKLEWWGYPMIGKTLRICITVYTEYGRVTDGRTDRQTDGQTSCHGIVRAMHTRRAVKTYPFSFHCGFYKVEK